MLKRISIEVGKYFIILLITIAAIIFIMYNLASFIFGSRSKNRQRERDWSYLKTQVFEFAEGLIPFEQSEFKILSSSPITKSSQRAISTFYKGFLQTIYQEPLLAFAMKESNKDEEMLLVAKTSKSFYRMVFDKGTTKVFINNNEFGEIGVNNILYNNKQQELARITSTTNAQFDSIVNNGEEVAHFNFRDDHNKTESDRLFSMFHDFNMNENDEILLLTLFQIFFRNKIDY